MKIVMAIESIRKRFLCMYYKQLLMEWSGNRPYNLQVLGKVHYLIPKYNKDNTKIHIGKNVTIYPDVCFWGDGEIWIGDNTTIFRNVTIYSSDNGGVHIGDNVLVAGFSYITDADHVFNDRDKSIIDSGRVSEPIYIGNNVWISEGVTILKGSNIEDGVVIGAKALVNGRIEQDSIAVGIPAKVIKKRF